MADSQRVFVYGTLMVPEVLHLVLARTPESMSASLPGYHRYSLQGELYPAIVLASETHPAPLVSGRLLAGIGVSELTTLDVYEGPMYRRDVVMVLTADGQPVKAFAYVLRDEHRAKLATRDWDLQKFKARQLQRFLEQVRNDDF